MDDDARFVDLVQALEQIERLILALVRAQDIGGVPVPTLHALVEVTTQPVAVLGRDDDRAHDVKVQLPLLSGVGLVNEGHRLLADALVMSLDDRSLTGRRRGRRCHRLASDPTKHP